MSISWQKVPWGEPSVLLGDDNTKANDKSVTDWFNKLNQYLLRAAEALHFKSRQLAQNAKFLPNPFHKSLDTTYKELHSRTKALLKQLSEAGLAAAAQKTWYNEDARLADTLVCAQVDAHGLASTQQGYSADAAEDLQQLAKREQVPSVGITNKTRQLTDDCIQQFLPANFTPMKSYFKGNQHTADGVNKMIEELALPQPIRRYS